MMPTSRIIKIPSETLRFSWDKSLKLLLERPQGCLPSNTITNPREQVNAIILRSKKELTQPEKPKEEEPSAETEK